MKQPNVYTVCCFTCLIMAGMLTYSCRKDGNPNKLPAVSTADYAGKIDGYTSSDELFAENLIAYWSFDDTPNELKTGTVPTQSANNSFVDGGVKGKALNLNAGYVYYAVQFPKFKTDSLKSWSISMWTKIKNNGSKRTMLLQIARPGVFAGNINVILNTQAYPATNDSILRINPTFTAVNVNTGAVNQQDNLNNVLDRIPLNDWVHIVLTYDIATGTFDNYANGRRVGNFPNRGLVSVFRSFEPNEVIIGSNFNGIPGMAVNTDVSYAPMTGQIDEIRIWNTALPSANVMALYNLGKANK